jgi:exodeoxyribonuclease VIII
MISYDMSMSDYLEMSEFGSTTFRKILQSPADFKASLESSNQESPAQKKGSLWHMVAGEPHLIDKNYMFQKEDWGDRTKTDAGKPKWDAFKKEAKEAGKIPIKFEDYKHTLRFIKAFKSNEWFTNLIDKSEIEVTAWCDFEGIPLKARCDLLDRENGIIWDIKTTREDMSYNSLSKLIYKHRYHFQAAHQMQVFIENGIDVNRWGWIFISTATPAVHIVAKEASKELLRRAHSDFMTAVEQYQECSTTKDWWGLSNISNEYPEYIDLPEFTDKLY